MRTLLGHMPYAKDRAGRGRAQCRLLSKPELSRNHGELTFDLSYSGDDSVIARGFRVGGEIERDSTVADTQAIVRHDFTPGERSLLETANPGERRGRFLVIWTAKEAYAKELGLGYALDPTAFEVRPVAGRFRVFDSTRPESRWWVRSLWLDRTLLRGPASPTTVPCLIWSGRP